MVVVAYTGKNKDFGAFIQMLKEIAQENPGYIQQAMAECKQIAGYGK